MNIYEKEIKKISKKYFSDDLVKSSNIPGILENFLKIKYVKKIAIWGAGEHTRQIFKFFPQLSSNVVCIIDNNCKVENEYLNGIKIINPKHIDKEIIESIILSTFSSRKTIAHQIYEISSHIEVIDLYDYLQKEHSIFLDTPFYIKRNLYLDIDYFRKQIDKTKNSIDRDLAIEKTINLYLYIRDIYNVNLYIDKYKNFISKRLRDKLLNLKEDLDILVSDLKLKLKQRKGDDLMLLFFDSLGAKDVYDSNVMPYLKSTLESSTYLTNAFSTGLVTYESIPSMFSGNMPFFNSLYKKNCLSQEECPFICDAINKKYKVKVYSEKIWHIIDGKDVEVEEFNDYASQTLWKGITDLAGDESEKCMYILYFLRETHPPHVCGKHKKNIVGHVTLFTNTDSVDQTQEDFSNQYYECLSYIDYQLKFYETLINKNVSEIIFSDHGQVVEQAKNSVNEIGTLASWHDEKFHVPIIIKDNKIKSSRNEQLFSTINFNKLIIGILNHELNLVESNMVEMNFSSTQNSIIRENYIKAGCEDYIDGYKVFRSNKYKVAITGNDEIKVYNVGNKEKEILDEQLKNKIIHEFKKVADFKIPKFN